jgi:WD40 repeat protein
MVSLAVDHLFPENADIVDLVLRHYYHGARGWEKARFDAEIWSVQYGPAGDVIAAGAGDGRIHLICAQTGAKFLCLNGHR